VRHVWFGVALIAAFLAALPMAFPLALNHCQTLGTQELVDDCFARNQVNWNAYFGIAAFTILVALCLHVFRSRWKWLAVIAVPVAPFLSTYVAGV
jgi:uncharacterized membrane protein